MIDLIIWLILGSCALVAIGFLVLAMVRVILHDLKEDKERHK